jgi:hypothetical protein
MDRLDNAAYPMAVHAGIFGALGAAAGLAFGVGLGGRGRAARGLAWGLAGALAASAAFDLFGALALPLEQMDRPVPVTPAARLAGRLVVAAFVSAAAVLSAGPGRAR